MTCELEVPEYAVCSGDRVMFVGDIDDRGFDFSKFKAIRAGQTVSSGEITIDDETVATVGSPTATVSGSVASGLFTAVAAGNTLVKCQATTSTNRKLTLVGRLIVVQPLDCSTWGSDS